MSWVGFEPTIPASERGKTVHALDRAATVTGVFQVTNGTKYEYIAGATTEAKYPPTWGGTF
jgi:hypothetical protein